MNKVKALVISVIAAVVSFAGYAYVAGDTIQALNPSARDCTTNSIIYCGAITPDELVTKYAANKTGDLPALYSHYGISAAMINGKTQKQGYVTRTGDVYYNGKIVARKAISVGREYRANSWTLSVGGNTYYERYAGTNYAATTDAIATHLWFDANGKFIGGIMYSCGNPVRATPEEVPVAVCESLVVDKISRTKFRLTGKAVASGGATISAIHYYVYDAAGTPVASVPGPDGQATSSVEVTISTPGTYKVQAIALTSLGNKTSDACTRMVTVDPEPCTVPGKENLPKDSPLCVEDKPSVKVEKTVNGKELATVKVGESFTYEITVTNTGNVVLKDVAVSDTAPAGISFLTADSGTLQNSTWTHTIAELKTGESKTFTLTAKYNEYRGGTHTNTVCVDTPTVPGKPDDCDDASTNTKEDITVCDTKTNQISTIERSQLDSSHMTTDQTKCGDIKVCVLADKTEKTIPKNQYNTSLHTTDMSKCANPKVDPPIELPHTGIADVLSGGIGVSSLIGATTYYVASRRAIR